MALILYKDCEIFCVSTRKYEKVENDTFVESIQKHCGHARFPYKELTYALDYETNKKKFKWVSLSKEKKEEDELE